ncbi:MAG: hypothetical protein H7Y03_10450 [Chitinophagaceae bacterium]|nr:hypothetical protein [Chitinophagaceae bacterium]
MNKLYAFLFTAVILCLFSEICIAQTGTSSPYTIARSRVLFHDKIDAQQKRLFKMGARADTFRIAGDETVNLQLEYSLVKGVDELQKSIETDTTLADNEKVKYLRGLEYLISGFNDHYRKKDYPPTLAPALMEAYMEAMQLDRKKESIEPVIEKYSYGVGMILVECFKFPENKGVQPSRLLLVNKYLGLHPDQILPRLRTNPDLPMADSLLKVAAHRDPRTFYNYAAPNDRLGTRIRAHQDPFIATLAKMARSKSGMLYFPFIDMVLSNKISFEDIDKVKDDGLSYYRLMVKTRINYAGRLLARDTPLEMRALTAMMAKKAKDVFISQINGLHTATDAVRFKCLEPLTAQELYYLAVLGEDEIYTSSYTRGVFPRMYQKMAAPRTDSLLMSVNGDYFRKFIKMAAAYNTLDFVLKSMTQESSASLMKAFMIGLEKTTTEDNVEDAVDVADSYSSIFEKNKELAAFMLNEAVWNYERCEKMGDKNGKVIYQLERTLFESADTSRKTNLSAVLGIPPIYSVDYNTLKDDTGRVVQQLFFYGDDDKDGQNSFANFMAMFRGRAEWSIAENPDWVSIKSTKGKPVWIFANKPLLGDDDPDAAAQAKLAQYLESKGISPTIFIHRGHSYHVKYSLAQIQPTARIVILGSCGGYNNMNEVLTISPDAHIISSKQVGTKTVNEPILQAINNDLRNGKNIDWIPMWRELSKEFKGDSKELFDDYVPPYKNLG